MTLVKMYKNETVNIIFTVFVLKEMCFFMRADLNLSLQKPIKPYKYLSWTKIQTFYSVLG